MSKKKFGDVLTLKETCAYLQISRTHLYEIMRANQIKFSDIGINNSKRHQYRFMKEDLIKYLKSNQRENFDDYKPAEGDAE